MNNDPAAMAERVDAARESEFWRQNWLDRRYAQGDFNYEQDWSPAYRYGVDAFARHPGQRYEDIEGELSRGWADARAKSRLTWDHARHAVRDAWQRVSAAVERALPGDADRDGR